MNFETKPLSAGLYFVATPIGSARDITLRALDVLASADVIASEDTRTTRRLMEIHGVPLRDRPLISYHDHNGPKVRPRLLGLLEQGKSVAYASDAGTPLVADPGFVLARDAVDAGHMVTAVPGPSAVLAALTLSGLPSDRFMFAGFPPTTGAQRRRVLEELKAVPATLVFFESPKRVGAFLQECSTVLGSDRSAALCRELTKKFEEVRRDTLARLAEDVTARPVKGEVVVIIDRAGVQDVGKEDILAALDAVSEKMSVKDAAAHVAAQLDVPRREVYQLALSRNR